MDRNGHKKVIYKGTFISNRSLLGDTGFFRLQGIKILCRLQFLGYLRTLSLEFQKAQTKIEVGFLRQPTEQSGQLQFWSEPSEILNLRSSNTHKTAAFTLP